MQKWKGQCSREGWFGKSQERWDLVSLVTEEEVASAVVSGEWWQQAVATARGYSLMLQSSCRSQILLPLAAACVYYSPGSATVGLEDLTSF